MLGGVEDVAALPDVHEEADRELLVADRVREADGEVGLAIVATIDERRGAEWKAGGRVDEQLFRAGDRVTEIEETRERPGGESGGDAVTDVAVQPRIGHVRLGQGIGQLEHLAARALHVGDHIPREVARHHGRAAQRHFHAGIPRRRAIQVEQNEARGVAAADVVHDLVGGFLAVRRDIEAESIVEEAELGADFVRRCEFRAQIEIRTREAVAVATVRRGLELE